MTGADIFVLRPAGSFKVVPRNTRMARNKRSRGVERALLPNGVVG
jgi:hypothetical protein